MVSRVILSRNLQLKKAGNRRWDSQLSLHFIPLLSNRCSALQPYSLVLSHLIFDFVAAIPPAVPAPQFPAFLAHGENLFPQNGAIDFPPVSDWLNSLYCKILQRAFQNLAELSLQCQCISFAINQPSSYNLAFGFELLSPFSIISPKYFDHFPHFEFSRNHPASNQSASYFFSLIKSGSLPLPFCLLISIWYHKYVWMLAVTIKLLINFLPKIGEEICQIFRSF